MMNWIKTYDLKLDAFDISMAKSSLQQFVPINNRYDDDHISDFLFISSDLGLSWKPLLNFTNNYRVAAVSNDSQYIAVLTGARSDYIYLSSDYGSTWNDVAFKNEYSDVAMSLSGQYIIATTVANLLYCSSSFGTSWANCGPARATSWYACGISGNGEFALVSNNDAGGTLFLFSAYLTTYLSFDFSRKCSAAGISETGKYMVLSCFNDYLLVSSDFGSSWSTSLFSNDWGAVDISNSGQYIVVTSNSEGNVKASYIFYSDNFALSWTQSIQLDYFDGVSISGDGLFLAAVTVYGSVYEYSESPFNIDDNLSWTLTNTISCASIITGAMASYSFYQYALCSIGPTYISYNLGLSFSKVFDEYFGQNIATSGEGKYLLIIVSNNINGVIPLPMYLSSDYGSTWNSVGAVDFYFSSSMSTSGQYMISITENSFVYFSVDYGLNWDMFKSLLSSDWQSCGISGSGEFAVVTSRENQGNIYILSDYFTVLNTVGIKRVCFGCDFSENGQYVSLSCEGGFIEISSNFGVDWVEVSIDESISGPVVLSSSGRYQIIVNRCLTTSSCFPGYIHISSDFGVTWTRTGNYDSYDGASISADGGYLVAFTSSGKVYESSRFPTTSPSLSPSYLVSSLSPTSTDTSRPIISLPPSIDSSEKENTMTQQGLVFSSNASLDDTIIICVIMILLVGVSDLIVSRNSRNKTTFLILFKKIELFIRFVNILLVFYLILKCVFLSFQFVANNSIINNACVSLLIVSRILVYIYSACIISISIAFLICFKYPDQIIDSISQKSIESKHKEETFIQYLLLLVIVHDAVFIDFFFKYYKKIFKLRRNIANQIRMIGLYVAMVSALLQFVMIVLLWTQFNTNTSSLMFHNWIFILLSIISLFLLLLDVYSLFQNVFRNESTFDVSIDSKNDLNSSLLTDSRSHGSSSSDSNQYPSNQSYSSRNYTDNSTSSLNFGNQPSLSSTNSYYHLFANKDSIQLQQYKFFYPLLLGSGSFGKTYRMQNSGGQYFAIKIITLERKRSSSQTIINSEVALLAKLVHPNIVRYHTSFIWKPSRREKLLCIVTEFIDGGTIKDQILDKQNLTVDEITTKSEKKKRISMILTWITQLCDALSYLHSNRIIHRDIKPENIMLSMNGDVKLIDFGLSCEIEDNTNHLGGAGTPVYFSYEKLARLDYSDGCDDMWAVGCVIAELLCRHRLSKFFINNCMLVEVNGVNISIRNLILENCRRQNELISDIVGSLLTKLSANRFRADDVLSFIQSRNDLNNH